jgi:hypothetical protein
VKARLEKGAGGQFDVVVDGETIASKGDAGFLARLMGGGFPDEAETVAKIKTRQTARAATG